MNLPPRSWVYTIFVALLLSLYYTVQLKEEFIDKYCNENRTCKECSNRIGCAWCSEAKKCIQKSAVGNDPKCSADTAIIDSLDCAKTNGKTEQTPLEDSTGVEAYNEMAQKPQPPMVFTNPEMQYSPETLMASIGKIGADMTALQRDLPEMVRTTVRQSMDQSTKGQKKTE